MLEVFFNCMLLFVCSLFMLLPVCVHCQITTTLEVLEETPVNTTVGSLRENLTPHLASHANFMYDGDFFLVDSLTGAVRIATTIDRDTMCQEHKQCCGVIACILPRTVYIMNALNKLYAETVQLQISIADINDNKPAFVSEVQRVSISENSPVGRYIGLEPAMDVDVDPKNQVIQYKWLEATGTFSLDQTNFPNIRLQLNSPLDREMRENYSGTLSACDIDWCTTSEVIVEIKDVNDNSPLFQQRRIRLNASESLIVGSTILRLNATDADYGENAKILYYFRNIVDPDLADTFEVIPTTGEIRLRRSLDANTRSVYNFKVVACDSVLSECTVNDTSVVDIEVIVKDVNDNPPIIEIVSSGDYASKSEDLEVQENSPAEQIAVVKIRDNDVGENAKTVCELRQQASPAALDLSRSAPDFYSLRTLRSFDFEKESLLTATIHCTDLGKPPLSTTRSITLRVLDMNEYAPEFRQRVFTSSVPENSPPGYKVATLAAFDRDGHSDLRYTLAPAPMLMPEDMQKLTETDNSRNQVVDVNAYFDLDPRSGILQTSTVPLDREAIERITLMVTVTDSPRQPVFLATATISIDVLDENDNSPVFVSPPPNIRGSLHPNEVQSYAFTVRENSPRYTRLSGRLEAHDPDAGRNGQLQFSLRSVWALKGNADSFVRPGVSVDSLRSSPGCQRVEQRIFQITPDGGIETLVEFDRELTATYILTVAVRDNGTQPLATSTSLLVLILDENDNAPVWTFPTDSARQINITTVFPPGSLVARLQAFDIDANESSKVEFQVLDTNGQVIPPVTISRGLYNSQTSTFAPNVLSFQEEFMGYRTGPFYVNGSTGEILVADRLVPVNLKIRLRAIDCGHKQRLHSDTWMIISVKLDPNEFGGLFGGGGTSAFNVTIILVMIAVTAIISLLLIVAIVCVRRKPARSVMSNGRVASESNNTAGVSLGTCSHSTPFLHPDQSKETLTVTTWTDSSKDFYPTTPGSLIIDANGQVVSSTTLSYCSPLMDVGGDKSCILYGLPQHSSVYTPSDFNGDMVSCPMMAHNYVAGRRNHQLTGGVMAGSSSSNQGSTSVLRMGGSGQYEGPPLDADSGDSGRGPSEDGNQLESRRLFSPHPAYQYCSCSAYRHSDRLDPCLRSHSVTSAAMAEANVSQPYVLHQHEFDQCDCYAGNLPHATAYADYTDSGNYYPQSAFHQSPLEGYRTLLSGSQPSPSPQRFPSRGEESIASESIVSSLPRSRIPTRSTVTFHSSRGVTGDQEPIKLDLRTTSYKTPGGSLSTLPS